MTQTKPIYPQTAHGRFVLRCPTCGCSLLAHGPNGCTAEAEDNPAERCSCTKKGEA